MKSSYIDILAHKIEIPIIQRDYAQGRTDSKTNKIRKDFLDVLFDLIQLKTKDANAEIELDFIYGFTEGDEKQPSQFTPIDGQQRLTTLWLLYWFIAVKEKITENEKRFLANFVYETRHSTTQFCEKLIRFSPCFTTRCISLEIKDQPWYFETWDYDPSIHSMLVVLDDMEKRYFELNLANVWQSIGTQSCPFYMYKLDMKKVGLTDDLYIKMNSRGKPLTEFEYFKAGFADLIHDAQLKRKFELSIDGVWIDTIWQIVVESRAVSNEDDVALTVDNAFLNLFNFITSVIGFKKDIKTVDGVRYTDTVNSAELLPKIYAEDSDQIFLFETLDSICDQYKQNVSFWTDTFYIAKTNFTTQSVRLFFQHNEPNLLNRCLFNYSENRGLSFPEQLLLLACLTQFKKPQKEFTNRIRIVRNLIANSENELRESILGKSFDEIENYILTGNLNILSNFKTDQIDEEKQKEAFLNVLPKNQTILLQVEDSDIFRGCISLLPLDEKFHDRAKMFLKLFDEDDFLRLFHKKLNLLLCFGDFSQDDGSLTNLLAASKGILRTFFTTPGYNKTHLLKKTKVVLLDCLDFFNNHPAITEEQKVASTVINYKTTSKDWRYYFINYVSFYEHCHYGFYQWQDSQYCIWKMGRKQFNGYHWDPFLHEIFLSLQPSELSLENYGNKLLLNTQTDKIWISTLSNGFQFENAGSTSENKVLDSMISSGELSATGILQISQNTDGYDLEDRVERLKQTIIKLTTITNDSI